jgi:hypothetical protein
MPRIATVCYGGGCQKHTSDARKLHWRFVSRDKPVPRAWREHTSVLVMHEDVMGRWLCPTCSKEQRSATPAPSLRSSGISAVTPKAPRRAKESEVAGLSKGDHGRERFFKSDSKDGKKFAKGLQAEILTLVSCDADGGCQFRVLADQVYGDQELHHPVRQSVCDYIELERQRFEPYLEDGVSFEPYIARMRRRGTWGDNMTLIASGELYQKQVEIWSFDKVVGAKKTLLRESGDHGKLIYAYIGGVHYDSLHPDNFERSASPEQYGLLELQKIEATKAEQASGHVRVDPDYQRELTEISEMDEAIRRSLHKGGCESHEGSSMAEESAEESSEESAGKWSESGSGSDGEKSAKNYDNDGGEHEKKRACYWQPFWLLRLHVR